MSDRETKEIQTPVDGHKLVVKTYVTGRELRAIENIFVDGAVANTNLPATAKPVTGELADTAQDKMFATVIVSVDGDTENVIEKILDFKSQDYQFVAKQVQAIVKGEDYEGKKKQS